MHKTVSRLIQVAAGTTLALGLAAPASAASGTIMVPGDFDQSLSDTRATGHYDVVGTGLRIWTDGTLGSTNKVAEYVNTSTPLAQVTNTGLDLTTTSGTIKPGYQLVVDLDGDGDNDGILVGEPDAYGGNWWLGNHRTFPVDPAVATNPNTPREGGGGSPLNGTLAQWSGAYPDAVTNAFGFSLGSGVLGDYTINSITFGDTAYTFAEPVVLAGKEQCKNGGWATSTAPVFKNQGECVSSFASGK
ncbi:hypothetical protein [Nocardioides sp. AX2bis]|uniref:hypothetical protein n=1 Tax=Nocardioides sp. AX2bis TaxID=2653157 RepID=UPI00135BBCA0|nr:hypothetical protein [Nocardioides sp. AX2bis]